MTDVQPWIEARQISKHYGRRKVLEVDSLKLCRGERVLISGSNGSGKSTLLRILLGITRVDAGRVVRPGVSLRIGFAPQSGGLYPDLSLRDNIRLRRMLFGLPLGVVEVGWCIDELGLSSSMDRPIVELSGGLQRLAGIVVALQSTPQVLAIDEPLNGVDEQRSAILHQALNRMAPGLDLLLLASPIGAEGWNITREIRMKDGGIVDDRHF